MGGTAAIDLQHLQDANGTWISRRQLSSGGLDVGRGSAEYDDEPEVVDRTKKSHSSLALMRYMTDVHSRRCLGSLLEANSFDQKALNF